MTDRMDNINRAIKAGLLFLLLVWTGAASAAGVASEQFDSGLMLYEQGDYEAAAQAFERAVDADPKNSRYHHWLAKSYGAIAEQSGWFRAYSLAHRTRESLERAVELDANNREAIKDLADFHEQAPALVGGDPDRAESLRALLAGLDESANDVHADVANGNDT